MNTAVSWLASLVMIALVVMAVWLTPTMVGERHRSAIHPGTPQSHAPANQTTPGTPGSTTPTSPGAATGGAFVATLPPSAADGRDVFNARACGSCHSIDGEMSSGPTMLGLYGSTARNDAGESRLVDEAYLTESIVSPNKFVTAGYAGIMPAYGMLSERELESLVEYIKSLQSPPEEQP